ncbi:hypothetical protein [Streptomyces sp.]|uniref:hypothetical protein n=1 Tax=Streptomyces sp. TaxID=1931 RepID=UPI002D78EDA6|nr:hypothetical protein [Streptomyces sp.]HET6356248.1 hypothetical protein [Streptomyces sp.]
MAASFGVRVIREGIRSIGRVRNSGAAATDSRRLFFTDADVALPVEAIGAAAAAMDAGAVGGAIPPLYTPQAVRGTAAVRVLGPLPHRPWRGSGRRAALIYQHSDLERQKEVAAGLDQLVRGQRKKADAQASGTDLARDA